MPSTPTTPWPSAPPATPPCCASWRCRRTASRRATDRMLVTGANGGVGTIAIALLSRLGFEVHASTTARLNEATHLKALGATEVVDRATLSAPGKPLQKGAGPRRSTASAATAGQRVRQPEIRWHRRRLRLAQGLDYCQRGALHPARRHARGRRQRHGAVRAASKGVEPLSPGNSRARC